MSFVNEPEEKRYVQKAVCPVEIKVMKQNSQQETNRQVRDTVYINRIVYLCVPA